MLEDSCDTSFCVKSATGLLAESHNRWEYGILCHLQFWLYNFWPVTTDGLRWEKNCHNLWSTQNQASVLTRTLPAYTIKSPWMP